VTQDSWVCIVNPIAGKGRALAMARRVAQTMEENGATVSVELTEAKGDAEHLARTAVEAGASRVVACGGDGTVHEVVNGMMAVPNATDTALGIIPSGRCNDLVFALGLSGDSDAVTETLLHGVTRSIDLGRIGDRYYTTVATLGFDSEVVQYVDEGRPPSFLRGTPAYLYGVLVKLFTYKGCWVSLKGDFGKFEGDIYLAATGNSTRYGGRMKVTPSASLDDGLLDLCLVRPVPRRTFLRMVPKTFNGKHVNHPAVSMELTRSLEIESREPLWLWADGEQITQTPATIEVVPHAISVLVPRDQAASREVP
jgi:diacylglycerol kinase (ATP)